MVYNIRFEEDSQHYAIMCYTPLIDLCTYPNGHENFRNILLITTFKSYDTYESSDDSSKIFESSFFRALVKFKWHTFALLRLFGMFLFYLIDTSLFTAVTTMNAKAINNRINLMNTTEVNTVAISAININRKLTIASIILGTIQIFFVLRWLIIFLIKRLTVCNE